jgi:hypothetical protein
MKIATITVVGGVATIELADIADKRAVLSPWTALANIFTALQTFNAGLKLGANADFNSFKGVNVLDPTAAQDLATKAYTDAVGWKRVVASVDTTSSVLATPTDIAGLSFAAVSGKKYLVRAALFVYSAVNTTGLGISAKATGAPTTSTQFFAHEAWILGPSFTYVPITSFSDTPGVLPSTDATSSTAPQVNRFHGYFVTTGAGTFQLRLKTEVDASAVTVKAGSYLEYLELP